MECRMYTTTVQGLHTDIRRLKRQAALQRRNRTIRLVLAALLTAVALGIMAYFMTHFPPSQETTALSPTVSTTNGLAPGNHIVIALADETVPIQAGASRYASISLSVEDMETLARLVWLEARGEPFEGQVAVAEVVFNRVLSSHFPEQDTIQKVVFAEGQFTPAHRIWDNTTTPTDTQYQAVRQAYEAAAPMTEPDVVYFSTKPQNDRVYAIIGGHYFCHA